MKTYTAIACGLLFGLFTACKDRGQSSSTDETLKTASKDSVETIQKMNEYQYTDDIEWNGKPVTYLVERYAVDSLSSVKDDTGTEYADNVIYLTLKQGDKKIFSKTFYKSSFKEYMEKDFYNHAILEGMAFDKVKDGNLCFAVSVSYPMSDLYIPLLITIHPNGSFEIAKDLVLDNVVETMDTASVE